MDPHDPFATLSREALESFAAAPLSSTPPYAMSAELQALLTPQLQAMFNTNTASHVCMALIGHWVDATGKYFAHT